MRKYNSDLSKASKADMKILKKLMVLQNIVNALKFLQMQFKEMIIPGLMAILVPVIIGFGGGVNAWEDF